MRRRILNRRLALVAVGALIGSLMSIGTAHAAATCTGPDASGNYTIDVSGTDTVIAKSGANLTVTGCSSVAANTVFDVTVTGSNQSDTVTFDLDGGLFDEDTQVPFTINLSEGGSGDKVIFDGTSERDEVSLGSESVNVGLNGPAQIDWLNQVYADSGVEDVEVKGQDGPDLLVANGSGSGDDFPDGATITGGLGNDTLIGGAVNDTLNGDDVGSTTPGADTLDGGLGDDIENGGPGNDTFNQDSSANGQDDLVGGAGRDGVDYSRRSNTVTVTVDSTTGGDNDGENNEKDHVTEVEEVLGGDGNDALTASAAQADPDLAPKQLINGGDGDDTITGGQGKDNLIGDDGNDTINGDPGTGACTALSPAGTDAKACRDVINGGDGNDIMTGGPGTDTFPQGRAADGTDTINGGGDTDTVRYNARTTDLTVTMSNVANSGASGENDKLNTDVENVLTGSGKDTVTGNANANKITLGAGDDTADGGDGNDRIFGNSGEDTIHGDNNDDTLFGGGGKDKLFGDAGTDTTNGGSAFDVCQTFEKKTSCP